MWSKVRDASVGERSDNVGFHAQSIGVVVCLARVESLLFNVHERRIAEAIDDA
jgi:hypothetical protein